MTRARRIAFAAVLVVTLLAAAAPASAVVRPNPTGTERAGSNTEMRFTSVGPGRAVDGFIANVDNPFDPVSSGYPASDPPTTDWTHQPEGFAGDIIGTPTDNGPPLHLYCIDIRTITTFGTGYQLGTWDDANVPHVGYVAQLLTHYFPNTTAPTNLPNAADKAAAVQAAIWFFSDRYVLSTSDPLHDAVAAITDNVINNLGPLIEPPPPTLTISPSALSGPQGTAVGPFTVNSKTTGVATVTAVGATMYADAAGNTPLPAGAVVRDGNSVWLRAAGAGGAVLQAEAQAVVPTGNVYLYDGNSGPDPKQKLILAETATLSAKAFAAATFQPPGTLVVNKTITGAAAGQQGPIVITVTCNGTALPPFTIPGGTPAGTVSQTYDDIAAGSVCTVLETADGHLPTVTVRKSGSGIEVTIPSGGTATADLSDTFAVGSLIVNKTITGNGAGQQGRVTITVRCGTTAEPDFVIPAGTPAGTVSQEYTGVPAGTVCTATETANGATGTVTVSTAGSPQAITIAANGSGTANMTDTYSLVPGSLVVTKSLTGSAAGQQGLIGILVACGGGNAFAYLIPAGTAGGDLPRVFEGIPPGSTCTVVEAINGSSTTVTVVSAGSGQQVTVPAGGAGTATLTNSIEPAQVAPTTTPTTEPATMPETLPGTGGGGDAGSVIVVALAAGAAGAALLLITRRRASNG
jgi:hypothetical protein